MMTTMGNLLKVKKFDSTDEFINLQEGSQSIMIITSPKNPFPLSLHFSDSYFCQYMGLPILGKKAKRRKGELDTGQIRLASLFPFSPFRLLTFSPITNPPGPLPHPYPPI